MIEQYKLLLIFIVQVYCLKTPSLIFAKVQILTKYVKLNISASFELKEN